MNRRVRAESLKWSHGHRDETFVVAYRYLKAHPTVGPETMSRRPMHGRQIPSSPASSSSSLVGGTPRWMSPELLNPTQSNAKDGRPTEKSDCYALGMVILEVLSGDVPFARYSDFVVMRKVAGGERPERPRGAKGTWFTDDVWEMLQACWSSRPEDRPNVEVILEHLARAPPVSQMSASVTDDPQEDNDGG